MDNLKIPFKITTMIETYQGDWTADEIDAGLAGEPTRQIVEEWCENTPEGRQTIDDPERVSQLEEGIKGSNSMS